MRPAEIQARVRAGEAPEEIARAGSMPVERVLRFAGPVLQERALVVQRARATRCRPLADGEAPPLGEVVDRHLVRQRIDPESATWDAGRRGNGTWRISVSYGAGRQAGEAVWVFDPVGQHVRPNDDAARELLAAFASAAATAPPADPRPLSVVRAAQQAAGERPATADPEPPPAVAPPPPAPAARDEEPARHVSIPSWDDIVFGVRGRKA